MKPGLNAYSRALIDAQAQYPNDGVAAHRAAMRAADRVMRMHLHTGSRPTEEHQKIIDAALLAAFPEDTAGERGRLSIVKEFPDYILARGADGELHKISYTMKDGGVTFGKPEEVEEGPEDEPEGSNELKK